MESGLISLSKLFTERLFRIPDYQRGYAWGDKQIKDFWNDLDQLEKEKGHYAGVITLEEVSDQLYNKWDDDLWLIEAKSYTPYFVVDGQQRLTTSIILIQAITESFSDELKLNYSEKSEIRKRYLFDVRDSGFAKTFVFGYERDNPSYEFLKNRILNAESSGRDLQAPTIYTTNLENAKKYFCEQLASLNHEELEALFQKLTQKFLFNIFTIESDVEVCVAFETMNNRGKPLSYLELLKNRLIYLSTKISDNDAEKSGLRRTINNSWKSVYHSLGRNPEKPLNDDEFLAVHYVEHFKGHPEQPTSYYQRSNSLAAKDLLENRFTVKRLYKTDPDKLTLEEINNYAISLQSSVETWFSLHNPESAAFNPNIKHGLSRLNRLGWMGSGEFILTFFQRCTDETKRLKLITVLEKYLFLTELFSRRSIYAYVRGSEKLIYEPVKDFIAGKVSADSVIKSIEESVSAIKGDDDLRRAIISEFGKDGFYTWAGIRYFLYEYNYSLETASKSAHAKLSWRELCADSMPNPDNDDFISVEHIFPRNAYDTYWKSRFNGFSQKERARLRDSLGNLLPLSTPKNSSLSNRPFPEKVAVPDKRPIGYRFGCYAENEVSGFVEWNTDAIRARGLKMVEFLEKRWGLKFKDESERLEFLGISFLMTK